MSRELETYNQYITAKKSKVRVDRFSTAWKNPRQKGNRFIVDSPSTYAYPWPAKQERAERVQRLYEEDRARKEEAPKGHEV